MRVFAPCGPWRKTLNSQPGNAAAGKAALKLVPHNTQHSDADTNEHVYDGEILLAGLSPEERSKTILNLILQELDDDKAEDVVTISLAGKTDIADTMIVASGRSQRHVSAMADKVLRRLKEAGFGRAKVEGATASDWVLIDAEDVIVHLFRPEVRAFYNLERVWSEAAHTSAKADA
ncbi:ribosome silencing factor [Hyphococcus flavus]|uniref:Ribosomal silencing factor RsfS n=1 Tax=Hyphococcus flavus TaxID=1866326 RepID=A0AAE9ZKM3_9PROT|nr:ribosome silencing factor [Hyphococcus flavus]WDI32901.1 ribosome silencing factor [Hyphococcus flavus]